jgi:uncharacterized repeat protein (TIGR02543 family)
MRVALNTDAADFDPLAGVIPHDAEDDIAGLTRVPTVTGADYVDLSKERIYVLSVSVTDSDYNVTTQTRIIVVGDNIIWDDKYILKAMDYEKSVMDIDGTEAEILALAETQAWTIEGVPARVKVVDKDGYCKVGKGYKFEIAVDERDATLMKKTNGNILAKAFTVIYDRNGADRYTGPAFVRIVEPVINVGALPAAPARTGYRFGGWNTAVDGTGEAFTAETTLTEDIMVYAQWIARGYTLSFNANGGDGRAPNAQSVLFGQLAQPVLNPIDADQTFRGWNTNADGTGIQWEFGRTTMPAHDVVLYAQWTEPVVVPAPIIVPPARPINRTIINNLTELIQPSESGGTIYNPVETPTTFTPAPVATAVTGSCALLNLLFVILCLALMAIAAYSAIIRQCDDKGARRRRMVGFICAAVLAAANVILFACTQELFTAPMIWNDQYTIISALIAVSAAVATKIAFAKKIANDGMVE